MGAFSIAKPAAGIGTAVGSPLLTSALTSSAIGLSSAAAGAVTAGVGAIIGIGLQLLQAHELRVKQATAENQATDAAVAGWDNSVRTLVTAYNNGQAVAADLQKYLASPQTGGQGLLWQWYWQEVGPVVQPGRNGCMSGSVPHPPGSFCQGSYGAGCCVAYDDLDNSSLYIMQALNATETDGQPHTANVLIVVGSKYGGVTRPAYTVTLKKPSLVVQATGTVSSALAGASQAVNAVATGVTQQVDALTGQPIVSSPSSIMPSASTGFDTNSLILAVVAAVIAGLIMRHV